MKNKKSLGVTLLITALLIISSCSQRYSYMSRVRVKSDELKEVSKPKIIHSDIAAKKLKPFDMVTNSGVEKDKGNEILFNLPVVSSTNNQVEIPVNSSFNESMNKINENSIDENKLKIVTEKSKSQIAITKTSPKQINNKNDDGKKVSGLALTGFILSLSGLLVAAIILGPLGLIFSAVGLAMITANPEKYRGLGYAITGIVVGIIDIIAAVIIISALKK